MLLTPTPMMSPTSTLGIGRHIIKHFVAFNVTEDNGLVLNLRYTLHMLVLGKLFKAKTRSSIHHSYWSGLCTFEWVAKKVAALYNIVYSPWTINETDGLIKVLQNKGS